MYKIYIMNDIHFKFPGIASKIFFAGIQNLFVVSNSITDLLSFIQQKLILALLQLNILSIWRCFGK